MAVVETGYPFTTADDDGWEATWTGVPGNGWDPADSSTGNAWENQALSGFDDRALPAMRALGRG